MTETILWTLISLFGAVIASWALRLLFTAKRRIPAGPNYDKDRGHVNRYIAVQGIALAGDFLGVLSGVLTLDGMLFDREAPWYWFFWQQPGMTQEALINLYSIVGRSFAFFLISVTLYWTWVEAERIDFVPMPDWFKKLIGRGASQ
jgi:hypothetical protein